MAFIRTPKKINRLYPLVTKLVTLSTSNRRVQLCVEHQFRELDKQFNSPDRTRIMLSGLGAFIMTKASYSRTIKTLIGKIRKFKRKNPHKVQYYKDHLRHWWSLRHKIK